MRGEELKLSLIRQIKDKSPGVLSLLRQHRTKQTKAPLYKDLVRYVDSDSSLEIVFKRYSEEAKEAHYTVDFSEIDANNETAMCLKLRNLSNFQVKVFYEEFLTIAGGCICFDLYEMVVFRKGNELKLGKNQIFNTIYFDIDNVCFLESEKLNLNMDAILQARNKTLDYNDLVITPDFITDLYRLVDHSETGEKPVIFKVFYDACVKGPTLSDGSPMHYLIDVLNSNCIKHDKQKPF